jgi:GNAT superfamily N-acetyltransferase
MVMLPPPREMADLMPDEPAWVDLRGLLLSGRCAVYADGDPRRGFVARSWDFPFAAVAGEPGAGALHRAVVDAERDGMPGAWEEWHVLAPAGSAGALAAALPGWRQRGVTLHRFARELPPAAPVPPAGVEIQLLPEGSAAAGLDLSHLPPATGHEMSLDWVASRPMAAALAGDRAVAFCYAPFATASLWDVAVDTLEPYRRRGLAAACFEALAVHLGREGRRPVWGAMDSNTPSMRLAERLGFVREAGLVSFVRPPDASAP